MTTRALLHSLLVCHLPLSTTWLVCFLSLIYFILHGTSFKKKKRQKESNIGIPTTFRTQTQTRDLFKLRYTNRRTPVGGRKHHISITLYSHGFHSFGQSCWMIFMICLKKEKKNMMQCLVQYRDGTIYDITVYFDLKKTKNGNNNLLWGILNIVIIDIMAP